MQRVRPSAELEDEKNVDVTSVAVMPFKPVKPCSHKPCESIKRPKLPCSGQEGSLNSLTKDGLTQRETHIYSERQRRKNMRDSFSTLQSLVPKLKLNHTDRITVLTEVINYIRSLRGTLEELDRKRSDIMALLGLSEDYGTSTCYLYHVHDDSSCVAKDEAESTVEVSVRLSGSDVFITMNIPKRRGVWSAVLMFLHKNCVEIVNATMTTCEGSNFHCIHGKAASITRLKRMDLRDELKDLIMNGLQQRRLRF